MPIYAFQCAECGHHFDRLQKLSDPDPEICPSCGKPAIKRQLTAPSFRLAGGGWYETDFKKDGDKKRNLVDGGEGAKPSSGGEGGSAKSESRTEAPKAESKPAGGSAAP
ncbi:FmdB family zinc ribbon protein [Pseudoxanthomonas indica]|uniref:Putative regulatory protein, FmdB family n=1 Tax=Pseudoxanthomonas indica TaxID=428993 RepID=A0A1T5LH00_9GAMM|nr:zinc ribbon domain-containing protein [Pseudoxanthomonas indica]GGD35117.1 regulatory protein, FmdB family [Pseudoxanthomonas indica]SKC75260.1 putative regulatory protein, FmdB family [Pseudoxanthomonas indica]